MPGYEQYSRVAPQISGVREARARCRRSGWTAARRSSTSSDGKWYRYDVAARKAAEIATPTAPDSLRRGRFGGRGGPERGRQFASADSPDGKLKAFYRDRNLWLSDADGSDDVADHHRRQREGPHQVRHRELGLRRGARTRRPPCGGRPTARRSPTTASTRARSPDYFLQLDQTKLQSKLDVEPYPKAGAPNPVVDLFVYDVDDEEDRVKVDVRDGKPFDNDVVGPLRLQRRLVAGRQGTALQPHEPPAERHGVRGADPATGKCRVIVREEWPPSWVENAPPMRFLKDNKRFIWASERNRLARTSTSTT